MSRSPSAALPSRKLWLPAVLAAMAAARLSAEEPSPPAVTLPPMAVIGAKEQVLGVPGSGAFLDLHDLQTHGYADINQVLRQVPGVYVREEDGYGLFPNISLRGVDAGRSSKVTIMEDGVLMAPAPYSAPAAYYSPSPARMSGIEVLKGSSQIKYGPQTSGGVINYLSTPVPDGPATYGRIMVGSHNEIRTHAHTGGAIAADEGQVRYLIEIFEHRSDGFKSIDERPGFTAGGDTGFAKREPMLKLLWEPATERPQWVEFKIGHTELDANETYMGLSEEDFAADPFRRYAGSRFDNIRTRQTRTHLRHQIEASDDLSLVTTAYYNRFDRNWFKERANGAQLADPARQAVLRGEAAGELLYRNNDRSYYAAGLDTVATLTFETGEASHRMDIGLRLHQDEVRRFQRDDTFVQDASGAILERRNGVPGGGGNREEEARALAAFVQDTITLGAWTLVPGLRYERVRMQYTDFDTTGEPDKVTGGGRSTLDVFAPGLGLTYAVDERTALFGGVHRGFSLPAPRAHVRDGIREETSVGYELGVRHREGAGFVSEFALFRTDFDDLIVPEVLGAGGGTVTENVGQATTYGAELKVAYDPGAARNWTVRNPWHLAATWTHAELRSDTFSSNAESIFSGGRKGARIPYVPEFQFLIGTGIENGVWGLFVDVSYADGAFTTASNTREPAEPDGTPNLSFGRTDSRVLVDVSGYVQLREGVRLIATVHNLLDEEYVAARHPSGPRPGQPMTVLGGLEFQF